MEKSYLVKIKKAFNSPYLFFRVILGELNYFFTFVFTFIFTKTYRFVEYILGFISFVIFLPFKKKPSSDKVLLCTDKYLNKISAFGESLSKIMLCETLDDFNKKNHQNSIIDDCFYWDEGLLCFYNWRLVKKILCEGFGVIVLDSIGKKTLTCPSFIMIKILRKIHGVKVVQIWQDEPYKITSMHLKQFGVADLNITWGDPKFFLRTKIPSKLIDNKLLMSPFPLRLSTQFPLSSKRLYDICFIGQVGSYRSYRMEFVKKLLDSGYCVFLAFKNLELRLNYDNMIRQYSRSKIVVNFSQSTNPKHFQLKGRIFEAMATGAMLLEQAGSPIDVFFEKGVHYDVFSSPEELQLKVAYYLENPKERVRIADAAHNRFLNYFTGVHFWERLFKQLANI